MTKEVLKMALEALHGFIPYLPLNDEAQCGRYDEAIAVIKEALAQPEKPKYRRGNRLICLETEEYCVIHISGTDRQWVKFPDSHIGVYTNEQVSELFELLPKEPEQEPVAYGTWDTMLGKGHRMMMVRLDKGQDGCTVPLYTTPPQRKTQEFVCSTGLCHYRKPLTNDRAHQILLDMAKHIETFGDENITEQALSAECIRFILERVTAYGIKEEV